MKETQSIIALSIVAITVIVFAYRIFKRSGKSCGGSCSCSIKPKSPSFKMPETKN